MGIPKKALRESQLQFLTAGPAVSTSHQISRVRFIENGAERTAFYKKIDPSDYYPELLAKISVAVAVLKRFFQGKKSAEERLVYDKNDQLIGTTSLTIDGFQSFNFADEPTPADPAAKERVVPSKKTLLLINIIEILFGRWFLNDDDSHPHNLGTADNEGADIDFDMFFYWLTIYMKKPRPIIGVPKKEIEFSTEDWENFPDLEHAKLYHWPTYKHPGEKSLPPVLPAAVQSQVCSSVLPKPYSDPEQFKALAATPEAHQQKFTAAMKALITYQPDRLRARLKEHFGNLSLNYTSLDEETRNKYETEFPGLFNEHTNQVTFVDFILQIYQMHYNAMYKTVVPYMGCERNRHGLSLKSTSETLFNTPSVYTSIHDWMSQQNDTLFKDEDPDTHYDLAEAKKRYHQIWRDAFSPKADELLDKSYHLVYDVLHKLSAPANAQYIAQLIGAKEVDLNITESIQFIGKRPKLSWEQIEPLLSVDETSGLKAGLSLLVEFTNKLDDLIRSYYRIERNYLTEEDNLVFARGLRSLKEDYELPIRQKLSCTTPNAFEFSKVAQNLEELGKRVDFKVHLTTTDEMMAETANNLVPLSDERLIQQFKTNLFHWVESLSSDDFAKQIIYVIDNKYSSPTNPARRRGLPVKNYLSVSAAESNSVRLAYILSSGGREDGALNGALIDYFTRIIAHTYPSLNSIKEALRMEREGIRPGAFSAYLPQYTREAVLYGKEEFNHSFGPKGVALFHKTMYEWLDALPDEQFKVLVYSSLGTHEKKSWSGFFGFSRREEVDNYFKALTSHSKIAASIFVNGTDSSGLNLKLLTDIIIAMKMDISEHPAKLALSQYKYILNNTSVEDMPNYSGSLKTYAEEQTHKQASDLAPMLSVAEPSCSYSV